MGLSAFNRMREQQTKEKEQPKQSNENADETKPKQPRQTKPKQPEG